MRKVKMFLLLISMLSAIAVTASCGGGDDGGGGDGGGGNPGGGATLTSIAVTPANPNIAVVTTQQFTATGTYSDSSTQNITSSVAWNSSDATKATINTSGLATAVAAGSTTITATSGSISGNTMLTVTSATLVSIAVTPVNPSIANGTTQQFTATGTYSDSSTQDITASVTWSSSDTTRATINASGLAAALAAGSTTITATSGSISGNTTLTVTSTSDTVTDIDGNVYNTVTIGTQVWMKENLKTTKYRNGEAIPTTTADISLEVSPKYQWAYNGDESNVAVYGRLYTWYAATDSRGLCPTGWHVPTDAEWTTLTTFLGGEAVAGGKMKEAGTAHWLTPNTGADNSSGWTALPGGYRFGDGTFDFIGYAGYWWSATEDGATDAWFRLLFYDNGNAARYLVNKNYGFSVRCVRDSDAAVTDIDGNVYNTVTIGTQVWMKENLKTTKYRNGEAIGTTTPATLDISGETSPKYQWAYNGNESNAAVYGRLYTWHAVNDNRGLCPTGWHLPTDAEWDTLTNFLGGEAVAGGKMKEAGTAHWTTPNTGAGNSSGWTALPGGYRYFNGTFEFIGYDGYWWSATEFNAADAWLRSLNYNYGSAFRYYYSKNFGFSVRCVRGTTVTDIDGNVYNTVTIGTQVWIKENLKTTKYRNGDAIPTTTSSIPNDSTSKYQWAYNGDENNVAVYGRLYTWYTATDSRGLCPTGWHVPTDAEWTLLTTFLGGEAVAGGKMKEAGTTHWLTPNTGADNSSGFTALPVGGRYDDGRFLSIGYNGLWWSATEGGAANAWDRYLGYNYPSADRGNDLKLYGFSVRCVRD